MTAGDGLSPTALQELMSSDGYAILTTNSKRTRRLSVIKESGHGHTVASIVERKIT